MIVASMARRPGTGARPAARRKRRGRRKRAYVRLMQRIIGLNVLLLVAAVAVTVAVLEPGRLTAVALDEEVPVLLAAVALIVIANAYLLGRLITPIQGLTALARRVDLTRSGERMPGAGADSEAGELALVFNDMLTRLERERREATAGALAAQESERLRIAQELTIRLVRS